MMCESAERLWGGLLSLSSGPAISRGAVVTVGGTSGAVEPPALTITTGPYHNGQLINVWSGPNDFFTPYSQINIIKYADPGGKARICL